MASSEDRGFRFQNPSVWFGALVGPVFFCLAAWCLWGPETVYLLEEEPLVVDPNRLSTAAPRTILGEPPTIEVDGVLRTCTDCHHLFPPSDQPPAELVFHRHISLDHGMNDRCRNCHAIDQRNMLVLHDGSLVDYEHSARLCAKCHGPTYRDWQRGAHGRTNGYWDASRGEVRRLRCVECHNPHRPQVEAMDPIAPLPRPRLPARIRHHFTEEGA